MSDTPICDERSCDYSAKYRHSRIQGEMELERHYCGHHAGPKTHNLEEI